jgi:hypothetical protein
VYGGYRVTVPSPLANISYQDRDGQVSWCGIYIEDGEAFDAFMSDTVASRLHDKEGKTEFEVYLRGLASTGFARDSLDAILAAEVQEDRDWAVGEAIAEAYLGREHQITWPWNMERDKRNPNASLPGADLIGFHTENEDVRLALGEVKSSTDAKTPPGVMNGRSGMKHQIDNLANNLSLVCQLLKWLLPRCKDTEFESYFKAAVGLFLQSGNMAISLFGVLIRDKQPNELDLKARGRTLAKSLQDPTSCHLIAIYIPCEICDLPSRVSGGGL